MTVTTPADALEHVATYLDLKAEIAELEADAAAAKQRVIDTLGAENAAPGTEWPFAGVGKVLMVKGRRSEKLDRRKLAAAGVSAEVLDAATVVTEGEPSVRIEREQKG